MENQNPTAETRGQPPSQRVRRRSPAGRPRSGASRRGEPANRHAWIAEAAYFKAERRGFAPGLDWQDWFEAERELETLTPSRPGRRR
jgi:hypothetical protein